MFPLIALVAYPVVVLLCCHMGTVNELQVVYLVTSLLSIVLLTHFELRNGLSGLHKETCCVFENCDLAKYSTFASYSAYWVRFNSVQTPIVVV